MVLLSSAIMSVYFFLKEPIANKKKILFTRTKSNIMFYSIIEIWVEKQECIFTVSEITVILISVRQPSHNATCVFLILTN